MTELEIRAGETYGEVNGKCQTPGIVGNELAPGQVKEIVDVYDFYLKAENVTKKPVWLRKKIRPKDKTG